MTSERFRDAIAELEAVERALQRRNHPLHRILSNIRREIVESADGKGWTHCLACGAELPPKKEGQGGRWRKYCSRNCSRRAHALMHH